MADYKNLIVMAAEAINKAVSIYGGKVGAAVLMNDGTIFQGFNVESRGAPIVHAEVVATISAIKAGYKPEDYKAIAIICNFKGIFPACASCRQFLWEHTNPDLEVVSVDVETSKGQIFKLRDLYPLPFPQEPIKTIDTKDSVKVTENGQKESNEDNKEIISSEMYKRVQEGESQ